jgi:MFS family permease
MRFKAFSALFLLISGITWFSLSWLVIKDLMVGASFIDLLWMTASFYGSLVVSMLVGATVLRKALRKKLGLLLWILVGVGVGVVSAFVAGRGILASFVASLVLGASAGVGIPACLALFADHTGVERRGRFAALAFFAIQSLTAAVYVSMSQFSVESKFLVLSGWRLLGLVGLLFYRPVEKLPTEETSRSFSVMVRERSFVLYLLPWFLFALVNFVEAPLLEHFFGTETFGVYSLVGLGLSSVSAFVGGFLCDFKGRKVTSIVGFVLLGVGYAVLSLFSGAPFSQLSYVVLDGIAWGVLYVTFIFVVWGDLSEGRVRDRYYLLGGMPFLLSGMIEVLVQPFVEVVPIGTSFSLASFFLFLAILPLLYAPETLPEKQMKDRELKIYVKQAQKIKEKYA